MRINVWKTVFIVCCVLAMTGLSQTKAGDLAQEEQISAAPPGSPGPGGPMMGKGQFEPTPEQIDHILAELKEKNPQEANELTKLREKDPDNHPGIRRNIVKLLRCAEKEVEIPLAKFVEVLGPHFLQGCLPHACRTDRFAIFPRARRAGFNRNEYAFAGHRGGRTATMQSRNCQKRKTTGRPRHALSKVERAKRFLTDLRQRIGHAMTVACVSTSDGCLGCC